jgi:indolepyruvate ferredoxin oxidoreductase
VRAAEAACVAGSTLLAETVARYYFKLLAYKDEYEVARLYTDGDFARKLSEQFAGDYTVRYHFAPQWRRADEVTGRVPKSVFGPWMGTVLRLLARAKRLRGTRLDPFGYLPERRMERRLVAEYEETITHVVDHLEARTHALAVEIAALPEQIRGFGVIKRASVEKAEEHRRELLQAFADACTPARPQRIRLGGRPPGRHADRPRNPVGDGKRPARLD